MIKQIKWKIRGLYDLFRYDIPRFFKNLYVFRKTLWNARSYDYSGVLYAIKDQLTQMEPVIRNGYHVHGQRTADKIKLCILLIDRILDYGEQYHFDSFTFRGLDGSFKIQRTPKYSEAPRNSKLTRKIILEKENADMELLMKTLTKHLKHMWD